MSSTTHDLKTRIRNALREEGLLVYQRMLREEQINMHGCRHDDEGFWDENGEKGELIFDQILDEIDSLKGVKTRR